MTPLPISTITKVFHPRIVPIPNALITELFYYGLLLPNVAHSFEGVQKTLTRFHHKPVPKIFVSISFPAKLLVWKNTPSSLTPFYHLL